MLFRSNGRGKCPNCTVTPESYESLAYRATTVSAGGGHSVMGLVGEVTATDETGNIITEDWVTCSTCGGEYKTANLNVEAGVALCPHCGTGISVSSAVSRDKLLYYGPIYAFGNNDYGQIGTGGSQQGGNREERGYTFRPKWVRGSDNFIEPENMVMPVTGVQPITVQVSKFYIAGSGVAPATEYTWEITDQRGEDGVLLDVPVGEADAIVQMYGDATTPADRPWKINADGSVTFRVQGHDLGTAVLVATEKNTGYQLTAYVTVKSRDSIRTAQVLTNEQVPDKVAAAGVDSLQSNLDFLVENGYLRPGEFKFTNAGALDLNTIPDVLFNTVYPDGDKGRNNLSNAFLTYIAPHGTTVEGPSGVLATINEDGTATIRVVMAVYEDTVTLWKETGAGYTLVGEEGGALLNGTKFHATDVKPSEENSVLHIPFDMINANGEQIYGTTLAQ